MSNLATACSILSLSLTLCVGVVSPVSAADYPPAVARSVPPITLAPPKLESCLARESTIVTRSNSLTRLATNMLDTFTSIAGRVEDYYVRTGKTITNYNQLVSDIQTNQDLVQTALTAAKSDVADFSCTSNDLKGHMLLFLKDMKAVKTALKNYRTSIKNLIVAVRSVTAEMSPSPNPSVSPRPSFIPKPLHTPNPKSSGRQTTL